MKEAKISDVPSPRGQNPKTNLPIGPFTRGKPGPERRRPSDWGLLNQSSSRGEEWAKVVYTRKELMSALDKAEATLGQPATGKGFPAIIKRYSSIAERTVELIPPGVRQRIEKTLKKEGSRFNPDEISPCPFTDMEIAELDMERDPIDPAKSREMLVFLPKKFTPSALCEMWGIQSNINFEVDSLVRTAMKNVDQWFITSTSRVPENLYKTGDWIIEFYNRKRFMSGDQRLHGMDIRRYITFAGYHQELFGQLPDEAYWNFLWGASYDRSGILVSGFKKGVLNSHGWMKNWHAKFCGSRYITLAPREEINQETEHLRRVYRYRPGERPMQPEIDPSAPESGMN